MNSKEMNLRSLFDSSIGTSIDRRQLLKRGGVLALSVPLFGSLLAACGSDDDDEPTPGSSGSSDASPTDADAADEATEASTEEDTEDTPEETAEDGAADDAGEGVYGGTVNVALIGEPDTLDIHQSTSLIPMFVSMHIFETLFTWDEDFQIIPDLVDQFEVSADGLLNTLRIREGVLFHNGEELKSSDVRASIERWATFVGYGASLMDATDEVREVDDYTLEFHMKEPFGTFPVVLARQNNGCAIYSKAVIDASDETGLSEYIGTGPYRFVEHRPDTHVLLERFEDYSYRDEDPSGYGGRKFAYPDQLRFTPVPDEAARIAGLQAGDYHYLASVSTDHIETLEGSPGVVAELASPTMFDLFLLNTAQGPMSDPVLRQAVQAAVAVEPILQAMHGDGNFRADPSFMPVETVWHSTAGEEKYNLADPDLARELVAQSDYDGELVRIMTTQEYLTFYNHAVVLKQQLEEIGLRVEIEVYDWATMLERGRDQTAWDLLTTAFTFRVDPSQLPLVRAEYNGWWHPEAKAELVDQLFEEAEFESRYQAWEDLQAMIYDEVGYVKIGEGFNLLAYSADLKNLGLVQLTPAFWNTWLES